MEKNANEHERADAGAETAGQGYSPVSSTSNLLQDPFLVSVHIIANPGEAKTFQSAADRLLSLLHPQLTLFRVSERAERLQLRTQCPIDLHRSSRPCLSVILFLREYYGTEEKHEQQLTRRPWHYHHTEQVKGSPFSPATQDFFMLAPGTPLWALRKVHKGKEIVRFTLYCRYETYRDQVYLYRLLLRRPPAQRNQLYSLCMVYANNHMEIQLSFKRSPQGQEHTRAECTLMEIRVRNIDGLIPLLPHPCRPISDIRWQTMDHDGNRILLQVQGSSEQSRKSIPVFSSSEISSFGLLNAYGPDVHQKYSCQSTSCSNSLNLLVNSSQISQPPQHQQEDTKSVERSQETVCNDWADCHSHAFISMATEAFHSVRPHPSTVHPCSSIALTTPRFRINVDALVGAEETNVDTGEAVINRSTDLSVVSAYLLKQTEMNSNTRVLQAPSEQRSAYRIFSPLKRSNKIQLLPKSVCALQASSIWNTAERPSNGSARIKGMSVEDKREFFI